jgi:type II secretion system protein I
MSLSRFQSRAAFGFSLLEVMIAMAIFFMAIFSILHLVSQNLRAARRLRQVHVDATSLAADLTLTNRLEEGVVSGDFGDQYPGYSWTRETYEVSTNGLFQVDFTVHWEIEKRPLESKMSILLYRPDSQINRALGGRR